MSKYLSAVLAILRRLRRDKRMKHVYQERLRKAQREFEVLGRSGKLDKRRVFRAAKMLCDTIVDALEAGQEDSSLQGQDLTDPLTEDD